MPEVLAAKSQNLIFYVAVNGIRWQLMGKSKKKMEWKVA